MPEYISRGAAIDRLNENWKRTNEGSIAQVCYSAAIDSIHLIPAADVVERPRWIPVTEALPESVDDDVLVTDGEGCAVGYWRPDAQAWDSTDFGWLENRSEPPCGIHTVTHWMPLPPLPEPPKEE